MADLPPKARLFLAAASLAIVGFTAWVIVRLIDTDGRATAIVLSVLCAIGALALGAAVVIVTRALFSLRAVPYLLGRGLRRLLVRR